jgi:hypothetical protein
MTNMEKFEQARTYWAEAFQPQTKVERHLITLIAFQDLLVQRSMTQALSSPDDRKAASGERRQNALIESIDRLVNIAATVQSRRPLPPEPPSKVVEMPKRRTLDPDPMPGLDAFGPSRATSDATRKRGTKFALDLHDRTAA